MRALDDAGLVVLGGEIHGLLGENGSGKSTLIKVLAGYHVPDPGGELDVRGHSIRLPLRPGDARRLGLSFVHQDLGLIPTLSVLENLRLADLAVRRGWRISWGAEHRQARETFARYGLALDPRRIVAELRPVERALLAVVRAIEDLPGRKERSPALFLDEPTTFLPKRETDQLFALVRSIAREGTGVVFVSHDLGEVRELTDRVTVLRDGRSVGTFATRGTTTDDFVAMIVGRRLAQARSRRAVRGMDAFVSVADLRAGGVARVSFDVARGEVLGVTGLAGSGFEDVPHLLFGARPAAGGRLTLDGVTHELERMTPSLALTSGIALVPADRQRDGAVGSLPLADNVLLPVLDRYRSGARLDRGRMLDEARELLRRFDVRPDDPRTAYQALSGGNQQKALLAKWLQTRPSLLLLDEPTQGVDVSARQQIRNLIGEASGIGAAVLWASGDYDELAAVCDRVLVLSRHGLAAELEGAELTRELIAERAYATGGLAAADA